MSPCVLYKFHEFNKFLWVMHILFKVFLSQKESQQSNSIDLPNTRSNFWYFWTKKCQNEQQYLNLVKSHTPNSNIILRTHKKKIAKAKNNHQKCKICKHFKIGAHNSLHYKNGFKVLFMIELKIEYACTSSYKFLWVPMSFCRFLASLSN